LTAAIKQTNKQTPSLKSLTKMSTAPTTKTQILQSPFFITPLTIQASYEKFPPKKKNPTTMRNNNNNKTLQIITRRVESATNFYI
jgi:hypothetical protein